MNLSPRLFASCLLLAAAACQDEDPPGAAAHPDGGGAPSTVGDGGTAANAPEQRFFLPTGEPDNTSAPRVEVDARGGIHSVYPAYAGGGAYYAHCPADCAGPSATAVVRFDTDGTVDDAMIALDAEGRPQILLGTYLRVYYATCSGDCTKAESWTTSVVVEHGGDKEVSGEAFALDPQGHPRFLMHTHVAAFGIGQKPPATEWVACDADCHQPASWKASMFVDQIWQSSTLRFDAQGGAHVAMSAIVDDGASKNDIGAYKYCPSGCTRAEDYDGPGFAVAYTSQHEAVPIKPAISLALTRAGKPRIVLLAKSETGQKNLYYLACDVDCAKEDGPTWKATLLGETDKLGSGIDLALDASDHPRAVYTLGYDIAVSYCDEADCNQGPWKATMVESGSEMLADQIFPYPNCTVGAWFLHDPSVAITADGGLRLGYQARDISGGGGTGAKTCVAGTDMTFARMAVLGAL